MKLAQGDSEAGVVIGNTFNKYGSRNPIARKLLKGFEESLFSLLETSGATTVHEVGCGEGYWTIRLAQSGYKTRGSDFSEKVISLARENAEAAGLHIPFSVRSIYDLTVESDREELIMCCEVCEHLEEPERAIEVLSSVAAPFLIASVPREPLWRILNMARGKYWAAAGNTPGHIQHWSSASFIRLLKTRFDIIEVRKPLPWTMALCKVR
ncbi:MAG: class I SAM-dependent methyltransferase [Verrucomicrobia bacterium]|nr:MAG: class I SAM-dependent methyltransferase [Verrucomicrobiota bacterium]